MPCPFRDAAAAKRRYERRTILTSTPSAQAIPTRSPRWKSPRRGLDGPRVQLTSPCSVLCTVSAVSESALSVPATVTVFAGGGGGAGAAARSRTSSTPSTQPIFTLSPTCTSPTLGEPSPTAQVTSPPSVRTAMDAEETALTVPFAPTVLCAEGGGGGAVGVPSPAGTSSSLTSVPLAHATRTWPPTLTPSVDGEPAAIAQVKSRFPSCSEIETSLRAVTTPPKVTGCTSLPPAFVRWRIFASTRLLRARRHAACTASPAE